jgi:hypothetical protein
MVKGFHIVTALDKNKLECLSLLKNFSLVKYLRANTEAFLGGAL